MTSLASRSFGSRDSAWHDFDGRVEAEAPYSGSWALMSDVPRCHPHARQHQTRAGSPPMSVLHTRSGLGLGNVRPRHRGCGFGVDVGGLSADSRSCPAHQRPSGVPKKACYD